MRLLHNGPRPHPLELRLRYRQLATLAPARPTDSSLLLPPVLPLATPLRLLPAQGQPLQQQPFRQLMPLRLGMRLLQLQHAPAPLTSRQQLLMSLTALLVVPWHPLPRPTPCPLSPCQQLAPQLPLLLPQLRPHLLPCPDMNDRPHHLDCSQVQLFCSHG